MRRKPFVVLFAGTWLTIASAAQADPARDALACAGFWNANYLYERSVFLAVDVNETWSEMADAGMAAATRLGAENAPEVVRATSADMGPRLAAFLQGGNRQWFNRISRLCNQVLDREPELAPYR